MAEYISCRSCDENDCRGCNVYILEKMLEEGKFDCLMDENHGVNRFLDVRLLQAEAECRLLVLPCKVGDTVYTIEVFYEGGEWKKRIRDRKFNVSDVEKMGKWIFLSREEAEAALEGSEQDV